MPRRVLVRSAVGFSCGVPERFCSGTPHDEGDADSLEECHQHEDHEQGNAEDCHQYLGQGEVGTTGGDGFRHRTGVVKGVQVVYHAFGFTDDGELAEYTQATHGDKKQQSKERNDGGCDGEGSDQHECGEYGQGDDGVELCLDELATFVIPEFDEVFFVHGGIPLNALAVSPQLCGPSDTLTAERQEKPGAKL